jgi:DNA-binding GntR family transcriptional regulator
MSERSVRILEEFNEPPEALQSRRDLLARNVPRVRLWRLHCIYDAGCKYTGVRAATTINMIASLKERGVDDLTKAVGADRDLDIGPLNNEPTYLPLREAVFLELKRAILEGSLKPGQPISENKIASKLSVSRTPVREAIRLLERDNLVSLLPGRKVIVSAPSQRDIEEVYEIRSIVETEALRRITPDSTELIRKLEQCIEEAERFRQEGNLREMAKANNRFHLTIISALENQRLHRFMDSLNDTISRFRYYSLTSKGTPEFGEEHKQIISNLKSGNTEKAVSLLRHHLMRPKQILSELFSKESTAQRSE